MNKYYIIESTKKNKNGHVSHLMVDSGDGILYEISIKTGKRLNNNLGYWSLEDLINICNYKLVDLKDATFVGGWRRDFLDLLEEKGLIK